MIRILSFLTKLPPYLSLVGCLVGFTYWAQAEARYLRDTDDRVRVQADRRANLSLTARLVDEEKNAKARTAVVEATVQGVEIVDPAAAGLKTTPEGTQAHQAHFHYQVDNGIVIATTSPKLSFHDLVPGEHQVTVVLANNDHVPLGPQATLMVTIPHSKK